jgi:PAS domain S-box-containing protein
MFLVKRTNLNLLFIIISAVLTIISPRLAHNEESLPFRIFTSQDGMKESWVSTISKSPEGNLLINHGAVSEMSIYNGYYFHTIPSPFTDTKVIENQDKQLWSIYPQGFTQLVGDKWIRYEIDKNFFNENAFHSITFISRSRDRILYTLPEGLLQFNAQSNAIEIIKKSNDTSIGKYRKIIESNNKGIWIIGSHGAALLQDSYDNQNRLTINWQEFPIPDDIQINSLENPIESANGVLFVIGADRESKRKVLLSFDRKEWKHHALATKENLIAGWICNQGIWTIEGTLNSWRLKRYSNNTVTVLPENRIQSGKFKDLLVEPNCHFWIATTTGLIKYNPLAWKLPQKFNNTDLIASSIYEDAKNRLWALSDKQLHLVNNNQYTKYSLPDNINNIPYQNTHIHLLSDGRLIIGTQTGKIIYFHPEEERFGAIKHPDGLFIAHYNPQENGLLILVSGKDYKSLQIESYDGQNFQTLFQPLSPEHTGNIRTLLQTKNGDIWIGGVKGIARIHQGEYQPFNPHDGYTGNGAFNFLELNNHDVWAGGRDAILGFNGKQWKTIDSPEFETVRSMIQSQDGDIWVASGSGVHRFHDGSWISNTYKDGLPDAIMHTIYQDRSNNIWALSKYGLRQFFPNTDTSPPKTIIPLERNMTTIPPDGRIRLVFEGTDRWNQTHKDRLLFSSKLDNSTWSKFLPISEFSARGLTSGIHRFKVRSMDRYGNIDNTPAQFDFYVLSPWYKKTIVHLFGSIGLLIILISTGFAISRYLWLEKMVAKRTRQLSEREELYRALVENLQQFVFMKDKESKFVSANSSFCNLLEKPLDEIVGKTDFDFFPEKLAKKYQNDDLYILKTGETIQQIEEHETKEGTQWVELVKTPVKDNQGNITGILGIFWDITERIESEEEFAKLQALLTTAIQQSPAGIIIADAPDVNILIANEVAMNVRGKTNSDLTDITVDMHSENWQTYHPDGIPFQSKELPLSKAILQGESSKNIPVIIRRYDGEQRWLLANASPIRKTTGEIIAGIVVFSDVTEIKRIEHELTKSKEQLEMAQSIAHIGSWNSNLITKDITWSNETHLIFGVKKSNFSGKLASFHSMIHPDDQEKVKKAVETAFLKLESYNIEHRIIRPDGEERWVYEQAKIIQDSNNNPIQFVGTVQDITDAKKAEKEKVLLEEQLRQAQKMEAIGHLAGGIAHDFNNLIMAIQGYGRLVLNSLDPADSSKNDISEILKAADRAAALTRQLLAFSRKQVLQPKVLNINSLIDNIKKMLERLIGENVELATPANPAIGTIMADPGQIEQIIMNLVVNAKDAMPNGGRLTIETANIDLDNEYADMHISVNPGPYVMIAISDNGSGMDKDIMKNIFDPFFTTKEMGKGTGLGLSTVYGIVKQSNGNIWVYSEPNEGTTFKIYFPRIVDKETSHPETKPKIKNQPGTETILLVEDEEIVRKIVDRILSNNGYKTITAHNGPSAIQISKDYPDKIHLLLTDVIMPKMNGVELYENMKPIIPDIKILYMSGYTDNEIVHHGILDPGINFIQKPVSEEKLLQKVREVLDESNHQA